MEFIYFDVDENLRETTHHGSEDFPIAIYLQDVSKNKEGFVALHWHEELQFVLPQRGNILYKINNSEVILKKNDVLFINSKCLHTARAIDSRDTEYICIDVNPRMIGGYNASRICQYYVQPLLSASDLAYLVFDGTSEWHQEIVALLDKIVALYEKKDYAYELEIQSVFSEIWLILLKNNRERINATALSTIPDQQRLEKMLNYIQDNYTDKIMLEDIARRGCISEGECCRFFKRMTGMSPIIYLTNFRIAKSTTLLTTSDYSITDIAQMTGFGNSSYYTQRFKALMNCKPLEYRKKFSSTLINGGSQNEK